jgi:hypothetical protein
MSFIPANKPKSWVLFQLAFLALIGVSLLTFFAPIPSGRGTVLHTLFLVLWAVGFIAGVVYAYGFFSGRYRNLQSRPWREQVW